jgi:hypothetical protein
MIIVALAAVAALLTKIFHRGRPAQADQGGPFSTTEGPAPSADNATVPPTSGARRK